jgi:hypothetical protein
MFRLHCVFVLAFFISTSLLAGEPTQRLATRFEIQQDLFAHSKKADELSSLNFQMQELGGKKKSVGLAVMYSLLLPGLGEYYAEGYGSGKYFSIAEGALWLTYATFDIYGSSLRDDARSFAVAHAGVKPLGKNDQFYVDVGNFLDTQEFNEKRLREREPERLYDVNAGYAWRWDSDVARAQFKEARLAGESVLNNRKFVVTAIIINHLASAINAARVAISRNKDMNDQIGELQLKADVMGGWANPHGVMLTVSKQF